MSKKNGDKMLDPSPSSPRVPLGSDGDIVMLKKGNYLMFPGGPVGKGEFHKVMGILKRINNNSVGV